MALYRNCSRRLSDRGELGGEFVGALFAVTGSEQQIACGEQRYIEIDIANAVSRW
jgi:hypothetical protein